MGQHSSHEEEITAIVGLGNPGPSYENTRHNAGFQVVDRLSVEFSIALQERKFQASWGTGLCQGRKVILFKPLTYMNRSGEAVGGMLRYFGLSAERMLVIHDDLDLPCGRIRLVRKGGAGGHKGILSIIQHLGHQDFPRLKLGIGRPLHREAVETFVLKPPYPEEAGLFGEMIERGVDAVRTVLQSSFSTAMNQFNKKECRREDSPETS